MEAKTMILGFLMKESMSGYELKKAFSISFSFFSGLSYGSIYPALKKMTHEGMISMHQVIQEGAPNKKIYTITEKGRETFLAMLRSNLTIEHIKSAFVSRLFFFSYLPKKERMKLSEQYLASIKDLKNQLEVLEPEIEGKADPFQYECFAFGLRLFEDMDRNVSKTIDKLKTLE